MGLPGYALTDPSSPIPFPVSDRYGGMSVAVEENDLVIETERGRRWVYKQFRRQRRQLRFRITAAQLAGFQALHESVNGQSTPFYFLPDIALAPAGAILVRKEKDFMPTEMDTPGAVNGQVTLMYDYILDLTEEPAGVEVQA